MANYKQQAFSRAIARAQKQADPEKEARLKRAEKDFGFFCRHYMSEGFTVPFGRYQLEVVDIVSRRGITEGQAQKLSGYIKQDRQDVLVPSENLSGLLDLEPRDHGKSTRMSTAFPLWLVCTRPGVFPVIIGANRTRALDFLSTIKQDIEDGDRILEDFGDLKGPTWKSDKITLANGNAIAALGSGEGIRGIKDRYRRPTHIICDDLLKDDEVESKASRDKLYKWFKRTVMNLGKDAFIVLVNTILHPDDLPSRLIKEIREGKLKNWSGLWFSATTRGGLQGSPIWPERWSIEDLQEKRESLGPVIYATEWDNEPMAESDRKFRREWFVTYDLSDVNPAGMRIIAAVDPATGASMGDYSAIVIVGAVDHVFYVLEAWGGRVSDIGLISKLVDLYGVWRPREVLFEEIGFQRIYKDLVVREAAKLGVPLPMEGIKQSVSKQLRISALSPLVESGVIRFRKNQSLLMDQLENFPRDHDDLPDALEMCTSRLMGVGTGQARGFTYAVRRKTEDIINKARRFYG
jgi:predicted phage terminase large subunit-like protein